MPSRKNAGFWKSNSPGAETRNEALRACNRFGRRLWRKMERISQAKAFERRGAEMHIRTAAMNGDLWPIVLKKFSAFGANSDSIVFGRSGVEQCDDGRAAIGSGSAVLRVQP